MLHTQCFHVSRELKTLPPLDPLIGATDQGQGAGQALEDGAALAVFLSQVNDINRLPSRLTRYERCRRPRAAAMQIFSNVTQDQAEDTHAEVRKYVQGPIPCE
jgi:salicylate hydroxylase